MSEHNLTPYQRSLPKPIRKEAYDRLPMTCDAVRAILDDAKAELMADLAVDPADDPIVDVAISRAFCRIRAEVTQPFRDEQMRLLSERTPTT